LVKRYQSSFSAARAALLEAWRVFRKRRAVIASQFCQPVYEAVLWEAVAKGLVHAPGFLRDPMIRASYCRAEWIGDAQGAIDESKAATAAEKRISIGISSIQKEGVAFDGSNWEDNHQQQVIEAEARTRDKLGEPDAPDVPAAQPTKSDPSEDPDDNPDDTSD